MTVLTVLTVLTLLTARQIECSKDMYLEKVLRLRMLRMTVTASSKLDESFENVGELVDRVRAARVVSAVDDC